MRLLHKPTALLIALAISGGAFAVEPDETLNDPSLEARARAISRELRCVVCQSESIDDSNAPLARDLRLLVRERITAGDDDAEVKYYIVQRYGDYVLLKPPVQGNTYLLWLTPALVLGVSTLVVAAHLRQRASSPSRTAPLTADEMARLRDLGE